MTTTDPLKEHFNSIDASVWESPYPSSKRAKADIAWVSANRDTLFQYEGKWIAVYNQEVIASGKNGESVQKRAFKKIGKAVPDLHIRFLEKFLCVY